MLVGKKTLVSSVTIVIAAVFWRNYKNLNIQKSPVVEISNGKLQGIVSTSRDGKPFYEYLNIPYAKPPVLNLRFEPPEALEERWDGVRDASEYGPKCIQMDLFSNTAEGSEDCLQLNVHTPKVLKMNVDGSSKELLPVLFWIHGGLFVFGSGVMYRPDYFMDAGDAVLITVNYRLGSFGFMNSGDGVIRGNMGLKDLTMALKWVKENVYKFGGDKNSVTVFGESAGAAAAHYLMLSPMSKGLFHKIITQSGLSTMPWALYAKPSEQTYRFAEKLNCTTTNTKLMAECLKNLTASEIVNMHSELVNPLRELISVFAPTLEVDIPDGKTFLTETPRKLLQNGNFMKIPLLSGVDSDEGLINSAVIFRNETLTSLLSTDWLQWIPRLLYLSDDTDPKIMNKIKSHYFPDGINANSKSLEDFKNITQMFSDRFWNIDLHNGVKAQMKHSSSPIYLYYYTYKSQFSLTDILLALKGKFHPAIEIISTIIRKWINETFYGYETQRFGVCHGDEIAMQFSIPLPMMPHVPKGHKDYEFSKEIVNLWTTFAKAPADSHMEFLGTQWPPQSANEPLKYMQIDDKPRIIEEPFSSRVKFWNNL